MRDDGCNGLELLGRVKVMFQGFRQCRSVLRSCSSPTRFHSSLGKRSQTVPEN